MILILGILALILVWGILIAVIWPTMVAPLGDSSFLKFVPLLTLLAIPAVIIYLGIAVKKHKEWARIGGIAYGALLLIGFPIGTIIGAYVIWLLAAKWNEVGTNGAKSEV